MQEPLNLPVMRRSMETQLKHKKKKRQRPQFEVHSFGVRRVDSSVLSPLDYPARASIFLPSLYFSFALETYNIYYYQHPGHTTQIFSVSDDLDVPVCTLCDVSLLRSCIQLHALTHQST